MFRPKPNAPRTRGRVAAAIAVGMVLACTAGWASTPASARGNQIRAFANRWLGTPYAWGGTSKGGIDCSAYLREMFRELFGVELPRTTRQQIDLGIDLILDPRSPSTGLEPGDVIFYIDRAGVPNHVVAYAGHGTITHSVSGRGVVVEPIRKIFGRRVVARRFLVPSGRSGGYAPIPAAGPIVPREIPCPPGIATNRQEVRRFSTKGLPDLRELGEREICDVLALSKALREKGGAIAETNAKQLEAHAEWLQSIEALKGQIGTEW